MGQINQYKDMAAYEADQKRLKTASAVSHIQESGKVIADGVNVLIEKEASKPGDLAVFDCKELRFRFVIGETINKGELDKMKHLVPFGVVYAVYGDLRKIVSLDQYSERWAHSFEALLKEFNTSAAGVANITVRTDSGQVSETIAVNWNPGDSLSSIAEKITSASKKLTNETNQKWSAAVTEDGTGIILSHNWWTGATVVDVSGCVLAAQDDVNYQSKYALISTITYVRRKNGYTSYFAGCHLAKFCEYYGTEGSTPKEPVELGSSTIVNRGAFEQSEHCAALREKYSTYEDYMAGEHMAEYPSKYGAFADNGLANTLALSAIRGTNVRGEAEPAYPAAAKAAEYKVAVSAGQEIADSIQWHLPSSSEVVELMQGRRLNSSDKMEDLVNDTLKKMNGYSIYGHALVLWTSSEYISDLAFIYLGWLGTVLNFSKYGSYSVRPVSAL